MKAIISKLKAVHKWLLHPDKFYNPHGFELDEPISYPPYWRRVVEISYFFVMVVFWIGALVGVGSAIFFGISPEALWTVMSVILFLGFPYLVYRSDKKDARRATDRKAEVA